MHSSFKYPSNDTHEINQTLVHYIYKEDTILVSSQIKVIELEKELKMALWEFLEMLL
jgi:hypothetical protein